MFCPRCGKKTAVTDTRTGTDVVIRVRKCQCGNEFLTTEYMDMSAEIKEEYSDLKREAQNKHQLKMLRKEQG